jgi:hypothetical protein
MCHMMCDVSLVSKFYRFTVYHSFYRDIFYSAIIKSKQTLLIHNKQTKGSGVQFTQTDTNNPVNERRVDFSDLVFSLSSHRHSYIGLVLHSIWMGRLSLQEHILTHHTRKRLVD